MLLGVHNVTIAEQERSADDTKSTESETSGNVTLRRGSKGKLAPINQVHCRSAPHDDSKGYLENVLLRTVLTKQGNIKQKL